MTDYTEWKWYASADQEIYFIGPCDTREEAIAEALANDVGWEDEFRVCSFFVAEARKVSLKLSDYASVEYLVDRALEDAEENAYEHSNEDGDPIFEVTNDQRRQLENYITQAINDWQNEGGIRFLPWTFNEIRNEEHVVERPDDVKAAIEATEVPA